MAPSDSGLASGLVNTIGQLGAALGIAVLATLATSRTEQLLAAGANIVEALLSGFHLAFITSVALVAAGIVLGAAALRRRSAVSVDGQGLASERRQQWTAAQGH